MKKIYIYIIVAAVVVVGGVAVFLIGQKNKSNDTMATQTESNQPDNQTAAANNYSDACKLFTKEQLAAALGGTYGDAEELPGVSTGTPGTDDYDKLRSSECKFTQANDGTTAGMTAALDISLAINNYSDVATAKQFMSDLHDPQTAEGQEAMGKPTDVAGVGDQAFFPRVKTTDSVYEKTETLYVLAGKQVLVLTATRLDGVDRDTVRAGLTKLAKELK